MRSSLGKIVPALLLVALACAVPSLLAKKKDQAPASGKDEQRRAIHALNRLTFGPRPGDVQQVMAMGVDRWIDLQLHPEKISDSAMESRLAGFRTLRMSSREIVDEFPDNQIIRMIFQGKKSMPSDPAKRAIVQVQIARLQDKQERKEEKQERSGAKQSAANTPAPDSKMMADAASGDNAGDVAVSAKTEAELAAAAAATADSSGTAPNGLADASSMTGTSSSSNESSANDTAMTPTPEAKSTPADDPEARRREERLYADLEVQSLIDLPPDQRYKKIMSMSAEKQLAFADSLKGNKAQDFLAGLDPRQKETLIAMNSPGEVPVGEITQAKLLRAVYSERQLDEVMTDFWMNHFNVFINKGADRFLVTNYERDVIRPHALGKFEDLLVATAKSPAMLFYLDNWMSVGPDSMQAQGIPERPMRYGPRRYPGRPRPKANQKNKASSGLNENYGRELLELHTLSVNGGYSQRDVTEVAKVFTGWTIEKPFEIGTFQFDPRMHEPGPKFVLGHRIKPKGEDEGKEVLHMLATSPQTAHFISLKLAQRFVSDDPPPALVDRMAKTFEKKKGDIREVLSTLFHSPEFWDDHTYRAKVKTPFEFVVSAVRATGADVDDALPLVRQLKNMGMPLYGSQPPTGYSMKAETWVSSSSLLDRMNFALALTAGKVRGVKVDASQLAGSAPPPTDSGMVLSTMEAQILAADVSKQTHDSIMAQIETSSNTNAPAKNKKSAKQADAARPADASTIAGLLLGSPEFQRR